MQIDTYGTVKLSKLKRAIAQIEEHYPNDNEKLENLDITFEYIIGSFFPEVLNNIHEECNKQYTKGYMQGYTDASSRNN